MRFLGSGNAFADGGRSHACIHVSAPGVSLLLDCGGSSLPMIKRYLDPAQIAAIAVTHLHGDHFGGIPFLLDDQKWTGRRSSMTLGGPPSLESRVRMVAQGFGIDLATLGFDAPFVVLGSEERDLGGARVAALPVRHSPPAEPHGLRVRVGGRLIAYSGDATWSDELTLVAQGADLFICEATNFATADERDNPVHISYQTIIANRAKLDCERIVLTHLGAKTLAHLDALELEYATDGLEIVV
ncbi:MAG: MBL fold metallo-hydrolase [Chloroflexota bacterium]|nr:MBL fold metallo-hydrolase [Chloroflexota bacterium]